MRQLLNRINKANNVNIIFALQETHIEVSKLKYQWRGKHIFTPGTGQQGGVITLLSENIEVIAQTDVGSEAHVARIDILGSSITESIVIANIHAPCPHNQQKIDFFREVKRNINILLEDGPTRSKVIILGDFNLAYNSHDRINTTFTNKERSIGFQIMEMLKDFELIDCWEGNKLDMTWRHGQKMSRIDRILWSQEFEYDKSIVTTDWTYTDSDHSAVIVNLSHRRKPIKERVVRVDTRFMQSTELKHLFLQRIRDNMGQLEESNMDPHQKLEFLKMSIRSHALEIASNEKKKSSKEMEDLKNDISFWQKAFENDATGNFSSIAMTNLNELTAKRDKLLSERGEYLSQRVRTKWYQEGEKSTKYFLNLQRARARKTDMHELIDEGQMISDSDAINEKVETFYRNLYEKGDSKISNRANTGEFFRHLGIVDRNKIDVLDNQLYEQELLETLKTCSDSAPGPDGIPYSLIKLTWNYYGKLLIDSWNYAQITGTLTHSHRASYLRLLPKDGKDQTHLKNWRPITLSNCDFKIITKTLAKKLTTAVGDLIGLTQTAYIPDRQITDNLHLMLHSVERSSMNDLESMIVSLDAEKAFDSVEHWYIREILDRLGLHRFKGLFNLMYDNQKVDIILNGEKAGNYQIRNGVKQGDALSCILFIICMEPLIRNINNDPTILAINEKIPKAIAYADDITCIIKPSEESLNGIFKQYSKLTNVSGLKFNADKTEVISNKPDTEYEVRYLSQLYKIAPKSNIKINGIQIGYNIEEMKQINFNKMYNAVETQLKLWSNRGLSIMGKIQIYKTFGLSQLLYIGSVQTLSKKEEKKLDELIYRFIWNRDMSTNKAQDRLKRSLLSKPIKELGFGMLDFRDIIRSIRVKTVIRILNSEAHPLNELLRSNLNGSWVKIKSTSTTRDCLDQAIVDISKIWKVTLKKVASENIGEAYKLLVNEYIGNLLETRFRNKRLGLYHRHDKLGEIISLSRTHPVLKKLDRWIVDIVARFTTVNRFQSQSPICYDNIPMIDKVVPASKVTSKLIRRKYYSNGTKVQAKLLQNVDEHNLLSLGQKIRRLNNIKLKTILLRVIHGDVYCGTRLKKFGMTETDCCQRCGESESIEHLILECDYTKNLWKLVEKVTCIHNNSLTTILGCDDKHDKTTLTLHAEILRLLLAIDRPTNQPKDVLKNTLVRLHTLEKGITKYQIEQMLLGLENYLLNDGVIRVSGGPILKTGLI